VQSIRIEASSGLTSDEIEKMKREAKENEARDKEQRERVDKLNAADSLIFQTEKQLKEFGDKLPADKKGPIEQALAKLKDAHKSQDLPAVEKATAELTSVWQAASEELYKNSQGGQQGPQDGTTADAGSSAGQQSGSKKDDEVTDVDFEEVK
jgi:molecular chaperone DnaK